MKNTIYAQNTLLLERAREHLVGGVNSPVRSFTYVGDDPILIKKGKGSKVYDYDGNTYIDYVLSFGASILGHAHPDVVRSVKQSAEEGLNFGATNLSEIELASIIRGAIPVLEKVRFVNSGTEAVMGAIRLARGYTGREKIVKFTNAYHGHADYLLVKGGSGLASLAIPFSKGVPADFIKSTIVVDYGDRNLINEVFRKHGHDIAAVIVEPVGGNYGVIVPDEGFLQCLRSVTKEYETLLIFDEVITGFRFTFGSAADLLGIEPDLMCLGKIIGGGLPIGAYGGVAKIMAHLAPEGEVYQASTFAGNPVVMNAGIATLRGIDTLKSRYEVLKKMTQDLSETVQRAAACYGIDIAVSYFGTMFSFKFREKHQFQHFYRLMLQGGIYFAPSEFETNFVSFAHTTRDIEKTKALMIDVFKNISLEGEIQ